MPTGEGVKTQSASLKFLGWGVENCCILVLYVKNKSGLILYLPQKVIKSSSNSLKVNKMKDFRRISLFVNGLKLKKETIVGLCNSYKYK